MIRSILTLTASSALLVVWLPLAGAQQASLYLCPDPDIAGSTAAFDVTPNGSVVVGVSNGRVFRWSEASGVEILSPSDWLHTHTAAVSDDGSYVVSTVADAQGVFSAARWDAVGGWLNLGGLPGEPPLDNAYGSGYDVSGDGSVVVGLAWHSTWRAEAFSWTGASGMVGLGQPPGSNSRATAISADGSVVGGFYEHPSQGYRRPARWVDGGAADLFLGELTGGEVTDLSSDGHLLVGQYEYQVGVEPAGFSFTDGGGVTTLLPVLTGAHQAAYANGVSDQGVVVGWSGNVYASSIEASIWFPGDARMRPLRQYLEGLGVVVPAGVVLISAVAISADGSTVVGQALDPDLPPGAYTFFVARIPQLGSLFADGFETGDTSAWTTVVVAP